MLVFDHVFTSLRMLVTALVGVLNGLCLFVLFVFRLIFIAFLYVRIFVYRLVTGYRKRKAWKAFFSDTL